MTCDSLQNYKRACQAELSNDDKTPEIMMEDHAWLRRNERRGASFFVEDVGIE